MVMIIQVGSWLLLYLPLILILFNVIDLIRFIVLQQIANIHQFIMESLPIFVFFLALIFIGDWLASISNRINNEIETQLIGYLLSTTGPVHVDRVSRYLGVSSKNALKTFFKIKSKGKLKGFTFNTESTEIIPPFSEAQTSEKLLQTPARIADELLLRIKLMELEKLKAQGRISEEAYREIRKEIEGRKL